MMSKRFFLKTLTMAGLATPLAGNATSKLIQQCSAPAADDDLAFWTAIRKDYALKPDYINLENGYYNFLPQTLLNKFIAHVREINYQGSYYMRTVQFDNKKKIAAKLATVAGCSPEELIITRNTTESLDMIIGGWHWQAGDEAVMAVQDYGSMLEMFKLVASKHGVINKIISVPNHPASDEEIVALYANAITSKTKLLLVSHIINITGQVLPVRKICDMAHNHGVAVIVDGAHAFAHLQYNIDDLQCDYYGASLHKWLSAPLGTGMLYVKKGNAEKIWPLLAEGEKEKGDITRLNHIGTHPAHTDLAIADALDYYSMIGAAKKETRLRFLQQYWTSKVRSLPNVVVNTPADDGRACAIANVGIKGIRPALLSETLLKKYAIYTVAIDYANVQGCRITPNLYTMPEDLDVLVRALKEIASTV